MLGRHLKAGLAESLPVGLVTLTWCTFELNNSQIFAKPEDESLAQSSDIASSMSPANTNPDTNLKNKTTITTEPSIVNDEITTPLDDESQPNEPKNNDHEHEAGGADTDWAVAHGKHGKGQGRKRKDVEGEHETVPKKSKMRCLFAFNAMV